MEIRFWLIFPIALLALILGTAIGYALRQFLLEKKITQDKE